jgi:hypothetical protein
VIDDASSRPRRHSRAERLERAALVLILAVVAVLAGKVAFGRVVEWTMANSPGATPRSAGWTNGVISELLPIGVLLFIRHQKRHRRTPGALAWVALVGAFLFSLTAQLAQARPSIFGWIVAAMPSAAFMVLSKMVVSMRPAQVTEPSLENSDLVAVHVPAGGSPAAEVAELPAAKDSLTPGAQTAQADAPRSDASPASPSEPEALAESNPKPRLPQGTRPRSLTSRAKVEEASRELGESASPTQVAARAKVSESTARRYMPKAA